MFRLVGTLLIDTASNTRQARGALLSCLHSQKGRVMLNVDGGFLCTVCTTSTSEMTSVEELSTIG